jgi:hypothetical protein
MPAARHNRSQNAGVVYTLVDEVMAVVDALMMISSRTERAGAFRQCPSAILFCRLLGRNPTSRARASQWKRTLGEVPTNPSGDKIAISLTKEHCAGVVEVLSATRK